MKCISATLMALILALTWQLAFPGPANWTVPVYDMEEERVGFLNVCPMYYQPPVYDEIYDQFCNTPGAPVLVEQDGRFWFVNRSDGRKAFDLEFDVLLEDSEFRNGYALVGFTEDSGSHTTDELSVLLITMRGETVPFPDGVFPVSGVWEGICVVASDMDFSETTQYGYYDVQNAAWIAMPRFDAAGIFSNGIASVCVDGLWGHIGLDGEYLCPPQFELDEDEHVNGYVFRSDDTAELVLLTGEEIVIDRWGKIIYEGKRRKTRE